MAYIESNPRVSRYYFFLLINLSAGWVIQSSNTEKHHFFYLIKYDIIMYMKVIIMALLGIYSIVSAKFILDVGINTCDMMNQQLGQSITNL